MGRDVDLAQCDGPIQIPGFRSIGIEQDVVEHTQVGEQGDDDGATTAQAANRDAHALDGALARIA